MPTRCQHVFCGFFGCLGYFVVWPRWTRKTTSVHRRDGRSPEFMRMSGKGDSNPRPPPWQGGALPLSYSRVHLRPTLGVVGERRVELLRLSALVPKTSVSAIPPLARFDDRR